MFAPLSQEKWNQQTAAHLLNRAAFGGTPAEINLVQDKGLIEAVSDLVDRTDDQVDVPSPAWAKPRSLHDTLTEIQARKTDSRQSQEILEGIRTRNNANIFDLRRWWLEQMTTTSAPLLEKMTLFWHGHFATAVQKVRDPYWMWLQNDTLRRHALGNFATLTKSISRDPAMMIFLDLQQNRMEHPNENWARELMELFTVGLGNYTEQDVRESARAFTGYRINPANQQFRFAPLQHDATEKIFRNEAGPLNGDDVVDVLLKEPACARFIGKKIWRYFVEDNPPPEVVEAVAGLIQTHDYEMRLVLRDIFSSEEFYSDRVMRTQIKSPVQFLIQTCKLLEAPFPSPLAAQGALRQMGQILYAPPNVKGWDGGKAWISTATLLFRDNLANYLINGDRMHPMVPSRNGDAALQRNLALTGDLRREPIDVSQLVPKELRQEPRKLVAHLSHRFFQTQLEDKEAATFVEYLEVRKPDTSDETMRALIHLMMSTPQFQVA